MGRAALLALFERCERDASFRAALDVAPSLEAGVAIAAAAGIEVSVEDLVRVLRTGLVELGAEDPGAACGGTRDDWWRERI